MNISAVFFEAGVVDVLLTVFDHKGAQDTATCTIEVAEPDVTAPVVMLAFDEALGIGTVTAEDTDPDMYAEVFCDGVLIAGGPVPRDFTVGEPATGQHILTASVVDGSGNVGEADPYVFTVEAPAEPEPVDCALSDWEETGRTEGPCRADSTKIVAITRKRTVVTPPSNGGAPCGDLVEIVSVTEPCIYVPPVLAPFPHYDKLRAHPNLALAFSGRDAAEVESYRRNKAKAPAVRYEYPTDPDPRKQDAMKIEIPATSISLPTQLWLPTGKGGDPSAGHGDESLFVTWEIYWGKEFNYENTMIHQFKGILQFASPRDQFWHSLHTNFRVAPAFPETQPPGGPFVTFTYPHASKGGLSVRPPATWGASAEALANASLPYIRPVKGENRSYGPEMVGPLDTETYPPGQEWGVVAERWTRYFSFKERAPELDWESTDLKFPGRMRAFKWSVYAADTEREPTRILNDARIAPNPLVPGGWTYLWLEMNVSAPQAAVDRMNDPVNPRGTLTAYARNVAILHGLSKAEMLTLLEKP
jgi:hypothetical protein